MGIPANRPRGPRRLRVGAILGGLLVLVAAGVVAANTVSRYDIPSDDLFGNGNGNGGGGSGGTSASPTPSPTPEPGADITGPLNILLVGIDPRPNQPGWRPNADAVLILHVPAGLDQGYLFSLPRDLLLEIPAFDDAEFTGGFDKLTHAMSYGSRVPGEDLPDTAQGFALLAETVSQYTGIKRFDAGAVLNFPGFTDLVDALGGIDLYVDQRVVSEHREPDGTHRTLREGGGGYVGPQKVYEVGEHHLSGWEALDYARQRYIDGGDYARQRHQRQLIKALAGEVVNQDLMTDPVRLDRVLRAVGDALVFDGRGQRVVDFAFALRDLRGDSIDLVDLPGGSVFSNGGYQGERLRAVADEFIAAVRDNEAEDFLDDHPNLIGDDQ